MYDEKTKERFWIKVIIGDKNECWLWSAFAKISKGGKIKYGVFRLSNPRRCRGAHVVAYEIHNDCQLQPGLIVRHSCDNSMCCNPSHLLQGTHLDNIRDCIERGRFVFFKNGKGELSNRSVLTEVDVAAIRLRIGNGSNNTEISHDYNVTHSTISAIRRGKTWKHLQPRSSTG